jgi:hypothetical protein
MRGELQLYDYPGQLIDHLVLVVLDEDIPFSSLFELAFYVVCASLRGHRWAAAQYERLQILSPGAPAVSQTDDPVQWYDYK